MEGWRGFEDTMEYSYLQQTGFDSSCNLTGGDRNLTKMFEQKPIFLTKKLTLTPQQGWVRA